MLVCVCAAHSLVIIVSLLYIYIKRHVNNQTVFLNSETQHKKRLFFSMKTQWTEDREWMKTQWTEYRECMFHAIAQILHSESSQQFWFTKSYIQLAKMNT